MPNPDITCRVCGETVSQLWQAEILDISACYYECCHCGYVQTETPYWLDVAYASPINASDTGMLLRNISNSFVVFASLLVLGRPSGRVIDCAGGYGILVRLLRDLGVDALWDDPYCQNLLAKGHEYQGQPAVLATAFEAFEHFVEPAQELKKLLEVAPNVLMSTLLIPEPTPAIGQWWYYGTDHGQHIGFFRKETLEFLAKKHGKFLISDGVSFHLFLANKRAPWLWRILLKIKLTMPIIMKTFLKSKTWDDRLSACRQK